MTVRSARQEVAAPSRGLFLLVTTQCDIACTYCFYTTGHEERDDQVFSLTHVEQFADRLAMLEFGTVILTGGDPLSRSDKARTIELCGALSDRGVRVIINTSGVFLDADDCAALVAARPARIDFSIDSCDRHVHNRQRGRFDDTVKAITCLKELGYDDLVTTTVVTQANRDHMVETLDFFRSLGVRESRLQPAFLPDVNPGLSLSLTPSTREQLDVVATRPGASPHLKPYFALWEKYHGDPALAPDDGLRACSMGSEMFVSDAEGNVSACFHRADVEIGNILTDGVDHLRHALEGNALAAPGLPPCAGPHCTSLFDDPTNWSLQ